jgi:hypothetical protein
MGSLGLGLSLWWCGCHREVLQFMGEDGELMGYEYYSIFRE